MKRTITITENGKSKQTEYNVRDEWHIEMCRKYPSMISANKKKYSRKQKHKTNYQTEY